MKTVTKFDAYSGTGCIVLNWEKVKEADEYEVYRKDEKASYKKIKTVKDVSTWKDKTVKAGKGYTYYLVAKNSKETSKPSKEDYEFFMETPEVSFANHNPEDGILIRWNEIPAADGYRVRRKNANGMYDILAVVKDTQYLDKDVKHAVKYTYSIQAIHKIKDIIYSSLHPDYSSYYLKKSDIMLKADGNNAMISWTPDNKMSGQHIHWSSDKDFPSENRTAISVENNKDSQKAFKIPLGKKIYVRTQKYLYADGIRYWGPYSDVKSIKIEDSGIITTKRSSIPKSNRGDKYSAMINTVKGPTKFTAFRQGSFGSDTAGKWLSGSGCGVCSFLTAAAPFCDKFKNMTPKEFYNQIMAKKELGEISNSGSIGYGGMTKLLKKYGDIKTEVVQTYKYADAVKDIRTHLYSGRPVVITVRSQNFGSKKQTDKKYTNWAHFIALLGMTEDGKVIVADSALHNWSLDGSNQVRFKIGDLTDIVNHTKSITSPKSPTNYYTDSGSNGYMKIML